MRDHNVVVVCGVCCVAGVGVRVPGIAVIVDVYVVDGVVIC